MERLIVRFKSGKEYKFKCKSFKIEKFSSTGELANFSYEGGIGECPIYFRIEDIESIGTYINKRS